MLRIAIIAIITVCIALFLKKDRPEIQLIIVFFASIYIAIYILGLVKNSYEKITAITTIFFQEVPYFKTLLKILGITYLCEFVTSICKDYGYTTMGNQVDLLAKIVIFIAGIPILSSLLDMLRGI